MTLADALNIFLILALIIFTICISIITYFVIKTFKAVTGFAEDIREKAKLRTLAAIPALLLTLVSKVIRKRR